VLWFAPWIVTNTLIRVFNCLTGCSSCALPTVEPLIQTQLGG